MLLLLAFTVGVLFLSYLYLRKSSHIRKHIAKLPGPKSYPVIGSALEFGSKPDELFQNFIQLQKKYGSILHLWLGTRPFVVLSDADDIEMLLSHNTMITKNFTFSFLDTWLGKSLLTSTGDTWRKKRKIITPAFHFKILEQFVDVFNANASILIKRLQANVRKPGFDVYNYINLCTLDVISESSMGVEVNAQKEEGSLFVKGIHNIAFTIIYRIFKPWLHNEIVFRMSPIGRKYEKDLKNIQDFITEVIRNKKLKRLQDKSTNKDTNSSELSDLGIKKRSAFLDLLLDLVDNGADLSDEDIKNEVNTFMFAGHDTTSSAVSFTLYALMKHQTVQEKVMAELNGIFEDSDRIPTHSDLLNLKYLEKVIKESMRMWPPVPYIGRSITEDIKLKSGYLIPAGISSYMFINQMHYDPKHFPNPEVFDPERFNVDMCQSRNPFAFCPFSAGPRNCIGQRFAMLEMKVLLTTILRNFKILPPIDMPDINLAAEVILRSKTGVNIRLVERNK